MAPASPRVLEEPQSRRDEGADDSLRRRGALARLQLLELGGARRVHGIEPPAKERFDQRVLRAKVIVDRGEVDPRLAGKEAHRCRLETVLHKELLGGIEDAGTRFVRWLDGAKAHAESYSNERLNVAGAARASQARFDDRPRVPWADAPLDGVAVLHCQRPGQV